MVNTLSLFLQLLIWHAKSVYNFYISSFMWVLNKWSFSSDPFSNLYFAATHCKVLVVPSFVLNIVPHIYQVLTMTCLLSSYWGVCIKGIWAMVCIGRLVSIHVYIHKLFLTYLSCQKRHLLFVNGFVYGQGDGKLCWTFHVWICILKTSLHNNDQSCHRQSFLCQGAF